MNVLALLLVAVNPAAVAVAIPRAELARTSTRIAFVVTALAAAALAWCSEPVLDWLDVSPPTFQVAAGAVLAIAAGRWVAVGARPRASVDRLAVLTALVSPQLVAVAITAGTEVGTAATTAAAAVALAASWAGVRWQRRGSAATWSWAARLVGLAGVAIALALVVDGVKTV
jgi:small neutral amino acid transporter SnatA (MarC family)